MRTWPFIFAFLFISDFIAIPANADVVIAVGKYGDRIVYYVASNDDPKNSGLLDVNTRAYAQCNSSGSSGCRIALTIKNECGAFALNSSHTAFGIGAGRTLRVAEEGARIKCGELSCVVGYSICSGVQTVDTQKLASTETQPHDWHALTLREKLADISAEIFRDISFFLPNWLLLSLFMLITFFVIYSYARVPPKKARTSRARNDVQRKPDVAKQAASKSASKGITKNRKLKTKASKPASKPAVESKVGTVTVLAAELGPAPESEHILVLTPEKEPESNPEPPPPLATSQSAQLPAAIKDEKADTVPKAAPEQFQQIEPPPPDSSVEELGTSASSSLPAVISPSQVAVQDLPPSQPVMMKLKRTQRQGPMGGNIYMLDARIDVSAAVHDLIVKHKLGSRVVYESAARQKHAEAAKGHLAGSANSTRIFAPPSTQAIGVAKTFWKLGRAAVSATRASLALRVTVNSLLAGVHVECKSMEELLEAEDAFREAKQNLDGYIDTLGSFDGSEEVL